MGMSINNVVGGVNLKAKMITATRDMAAVSGAVAYTGVGFQPKALIVLAAKTPNSSVGVSGLLADGANVLETYNATQEQGIEAVLIGVIESTGSGQKAVLTSYDPDGFTLTWTKYATPTGTINLVFLCLSTG